MRNSSRRGSTINGNRAGKPLNTLEDFARWMATVERSLEAFIAVYSPQVAGKLDFSPGSLRLLEAWLLSHFPSAGVLEQDLFLSEQVALYVGEVYRRQLGGAWTVLLEPGSAGMRDLRGVPLMNCPPACCPRQLVTEALRKHTGFYLFATFEYFRKRRLREELAAREARAAG